MSEKLLVQMSIRFSEGTADILTRLAHIEDKTDAELVRDVVEAYIKSQHDKFILLQSAFKHYEINASQRDLLDDKENPALR